MSLFEYERDGNAQAIIGALRRSDSADVRKRSAEILGRMGDHDDRGEIINALVRTAQEDDSDTVVAAAIDALDELGQDALERLIVSMADLDLQEDAADWMKAKAFSRALAADIPELRMAAANALGELGVPDTIARLVKRFEDRDPRVRARAARACRDIGDARAAEALTGLLTDPKPEVRREAAEALGRIGNRQALQALLQLYDDDSERVRRIAVRGFGQFRNDRPVAYLVEALADDSPSVRRTAVFSMIELLSNVPTEQSHEIRNTVVEKLAATDDRSVVVPLVEILEESSQSAQRRNTAWLLGRVTDDEERTRVIESLIDALADDDQMLQQFAATSLAEIGGSDVERRLLTVVEGEDRDPDVRAQAVFTLGKVGGDRSRKTLDRIIDETENETIRKRAFSAISKLGGRR